MNTPRYSLHAHTEGLRRGELLVSTCAACARPEFPPRMACGACGDTGPPAWVSSTGSGRLWSFAAFHKSYLGDFHLPTPYVVAVVALDDGVRLYANVVGTPMPELRVDSPVHAQFTTDRSGAIHLAFTVSDRGVR